jgi:hypothetical protein
MTVRVEYPYLAFGPKANQKNILIYATDLGTAKQAALLLFKPAKKDLGLVHVHLVRDEPPLTYTRV